MKKSILTTMIFVFLIYPAISGPITSLHVKSEHYFELMIKPKPRLKIYFGRGMPTCIGRLDICDVIIGIREGFPGNYEANGSFEVGDRNNALIFEAEINSGVNQFTISECFSDGFFEMTRDFLLSDEIVGQIDFQGDPRIPKGKYKVEERSGMIRILFRE